MKYFSRLLVWFLAVSFVFYVSGAQYLEADPTDDFSFTLDHVGETNLYRLMSEKKITDIFRDRLDLFPRSQAPKLAKHLLMLCKKYRFDPAFILSLIEVESRFRVRVVSHAGAIGLMQLMPSTARAVAREWNIRFPKGISMSRALMDPFTNLTLGVSYLAYLRDRYEEYPPYYLVAAYNVGPSRIDEVLKQKNFKPVQTKKYFHDIRRGVPEFRFYRGNRTGV